MPDHSDEHAIRIMRIDQDDADLLPIAQAEMLPATASVGRLVDAISDGKIGPAKPLAAAHINDVRIRGSNRQCADRTGRLVVENRIPGTAVVGALPHSAVVRSHVEDVLPSRHTRDGNCAPPAEGADHAPA